jgi:hypothetical protein
MAHCPTAVPNAKIDVKEVEGGVQVDVTGSDEAMTKDIRDRMKKLEEAAKASSATGQHTGGGGGHGKFGHCAIVTRNTTIESKEIPGGVSATVKAKAKDEADWVRRETKDRLANAKAPGGDGLGKKHMQHCAAAVEGATTKVENTKDGVTVTVTGKGDATVKEIRDRAKHTVDVSKLPDDKKVVHTGEGKGGGALGRCPADPEGDTTIEAKDVEGGRSRQPPERGQGAGGGVRREVAKRPHGASAAIRNGAKYTHSSSMTRRPSAPKSRGPSGATGIGCHGRK